MLWQIGLQSGPRELSDQVGKALQSQLRVDSQSAGKLRFVKKSGHFARRRVKLIRIFDPALIEHGEVADLKYDDLAMANHREALLFNGHVETDGAVYLEHSAGIKTAASPISTKVVNPALGEDTCPHLECSNVAQ
jgi:hypothetical protein